MKIYYTKTKLNTVQILRKEYLKKLSLPQELFLEMKIRDSEIGFLMAEGKEAGYCCAGTIITFVYKNPTFVDYSLTIPRNSLALPLLTKRHGTEWQICPPEELAKH